MPSATFTVRVDSAVKKRLEKLAKSTGRSRSFIAAEAIGSYLDVNEWQVAGIKLFHESLIRLDRSIRARHLKSSCAYSWQQKTG